jgi:hypothetical protein
MLGGLVFLIITNRKILPATTNSREISTRNKGIPFYSKRIPLSKNILTCPGQFGSVTTFNQNKR